MRDTLRSPLACVVTAQCAAAVVAAADLLSLAWPLAILRQAMIVGSSTAKPRHFGCCSDSVAAAAAAAGVEVDRYSRSTAED